MPFSQIFKQAYALLRAHKFLWVLGLFLVWGSIFNLISFAFDSTDQTNLTPNLMSVIQSNPGKYVTLLLVGLIIFLILMILFFRSKASVITAVKALLDKQPTGLKKVFVASRMFYVRIFGIWFVTFFLLILVLAILWGPVAYLAAEQYSSRALTLGMIALIIFVPIALLINFINNLGPIFVVLHDMRIGEAIKASFDMSKKFWPTLLAFSIALWFLTLIANIIFVGVYSTGVAFLFNLFYNTTTFSISFGSILFGGIAFMGTIFIAGLIAVFQQIAWVLLFKDLIKPVKIAEEEPIPMPEVIS